MTTKETKRQQIRRAAYSAFREQGYPLTTVDMICKSAGISKGSFYWHFDSKQEVFVDILEQWTIEVMDELYAQFEAVSSSDDYVVAIASAVERETHRGRAIVPLWIEFTAQAQREPGVQEALSRFYRKIRQAVTEVLRPLVGDSLSEEELRGVAAAAFATYIGLIIQNIADPEADATSALSRFMRALGLWQQHTVALEALRRVAASHQGSSHTEEVS